MSKNYIKTNLNDLQLAEIIDLLKFVEKFVNKYEKLDEKAYKNAFNGLITALEYYRFADDNTKNIDKSFRKSNSKENIKPIILMSIYNSKIILNEKNIEEKKDFNKGLKIIKEYIEERKEELTIKGKSI